MNIYLVTEDGESFCIRANTMQAAIIITETLYLKDRCKEDNDIDILGEKSYYHEQLLHSCQLIAELKN